MGVHNYLIYQKYSNAKKNASIFWKEFYELRLEKRNMQEGAKSRFSGRWRLQSSFPLMSIGTFETRTPCETNEQLIIHLVVIIFGRGRVGIDAFVKRLM